MPAEQPGTRDLIAYVTRYMLCDACHHAYGTGDVAVTGHNAGFWLLSATCPACHHHHHITAFDQPPYRLLDQRVIGVPPLSEADVEAWARFLEQFDGDLTDLLHTLD